MEEQSEHKEEASVKKEEIANKSGFWKISTIVLGVLLIISLFTGGLTGFASKNLAKETVANKTVTYINEKLLQGNGVVTLKNVEETNELYNLNLELNGQQITTYATKDGKLFFPQVINLDENVVTKQTEEKQEEKKRDTKNPLSISELIEDEVVNGNEDAELILIEFSDYQCPACRIFYTKAEKQIEQNYIKNGKVRLYFKDFPLVNIHPSAFAAAVSVECANEQGKFWDMHSKIFDEQNKLGQGTIRFSSDDLKKWATEIGVESSKFNSCLETNKSHSKIEKDFNQGIGIKIGGTPNLLLLSKDSSLKERFRNAIPADYSDYIKLIELRDGVGVQIEVALPFEAFKEIIDGLN